MAIDGKRIISAVMEGSRYRDAKGIIPLFGVYLSIFSTQYYNKLSFEFELLMKDDRILEAEELLVNAAQECGYATFQGIRMSKEWEDIVIPMIESREDEIEGFIAVAIAFGWGQLEKIELIPQERLVIRAKDSYEARGYLDRFGYSNSGKCYMLRGVSAAFMDLLYGQDYPEGCFTFIGKEVKCLAKGDIYCEFVVEKSYREKLRGL